MQCLSNDKTEDRRLQTEDRRPETEEQRRDEGTLRISD